MARENRLDRVVSTRRLRVSVRKGRRPLPMRLAPPSVRRPLDRSSATVERVTLARAVAEVRLALEEAAVATAEAATRREREVLMLVAAGQTNKAIADALYVSPNTVKTHVSSLLHKLQADTRVQLAAIATKHGLN